MCLYVTVHASLSRVPVESRKLLLIKFEQKSTHFGNLHIRLLFNYLQILPNHWRELCQPFVPKLYSLTQIGYYLLICLTTARTYVAFEIARGWGTWLFSDALKHYH